MRLSRWRWHLDEMFVKINGKRYYLWCAVDHEGEVLESFVTDTRDRKAALKFLRKAMQKHGRPKAIVTDRLRSYGAVLKEIGTAHRRETGQRPNNRAENSHLPFRRRERVMFRFPADAKLANVRFCPRLRFKPLQPGPQPFQQTSLQGRQSRRPRRVARSLC